MRPSRLLDPQLLDAIEWNEPEEETLAYRYPMLDMEILAGAQLRVGDAEIAVVVDEGRIADIFHSGLHTLNAVSLPLLADRKSWHKGSEPPFKADLYFFCAGDVIDQKWGTPAPIMLGDTASGAIRLRGYGSYSYRIRDVRTFFTRVSGTRESYFVYDLDDRLRKIIIACMTAAFSLTELSGAGLATDTAARSVTLVEEIEPAFAALGLELTQFRVEALLLEEEGQSSVDERLGMSLAGDSTMKPMGQSCDSCGASMRAEHGALKCDYCHAVLAAEVAEEGLDLLAEPHGHACPSCEIPLIQAVVGGASLLYCTRCDGMLVAMEEFESLVAASRALARGAVAIAEAKPAGMQHSLACPQCDRAMEAHFFGGSGIAAIDGCEVCALYWLDHGQLARIAQGAVQAPEADGFFTRANADASAGLNIGA